MDNLISRQAAIDAVERELSLVERPITETRWFDFGLKKAQEVLSKLPSIDAVPVVRCKDCRYFHRFADWADCDFHEWYRAEPNENDYCSRGERRK